MDTQVQPVTEPLMLRGGEVASLLDISRALAYRWMKNGILPTIRINGTVRVPRRALMAWIESQTKEARAN